MIYFCCDERRRNAVKASPFNGIDYLEVLDDPALPNHLRQRKLFVHLLKPLAGALAEKNVRIEGGERIRDITVLSVTPDAGKTVLTVEVSRPGDFSAYTLRLVADPAHPEPPAGFDPLLAAVDFSFKVECPSDFDCKRARICPPEVLPEPALDYLAKDYASFRQLMLDRMAALMPQWKERNPADLGVALVELLAYVADLLSYQQDATATEAYLGTARRRVSVRRHARLIDYRMHDGSNARAWVQLRVDANNVKVQRGDRLLTRTPGLPVRIPKDPLALSAALSAGPEVFEIMHAATLFAAHNEMPFYTWGGRECCLPKGATRATLRGGFDKLKPGDLLILAEVLGPETGKAADADPARRHAVRLTSVAVGEDKIGGQFADPPDSSSVAVTEIEWAPADALPFALCVSARAGSSYFAKVAVAWGNIVLADHGQTIEEEPIGTVPEPTLLRPPSPSEDRCRERQPAAVPVRFRPALKSAPLTQAAPYDSNRSAAEAMRWTAGETLPAVLEVKSLFGGNTDTWRARRDLLASGPQVREFVVEVEEDGLAYLRFGDDRFGLRPVSGASFTATYRVGNGARGNIGAESLAHIVSDDPAIVGVRNPLPARGGVEPESIEQVRQDAPTAFRRQERAVTRDDYAEVAGRDAEVQRAAATFRWTGSWRTVFLTVDRLGGEPADAAFKNKMARFLDLYRMAGHDIEINGPLFVPLEIDMRVCVVPEYFRGDVAAALLEVFSNRARPDGRRGVFHPDNFTFGQPVYLSRLYAAAQEVEGVASVEITRFQRQGAPSGEHLKLGRLELERLEIARLDNDPNFPDRGVFRLTALGGK